MSRLLIELQYFGTISWFLEVIKHDSIVIEAHENFEKSTYRNRCHIASPEGRLRMTIPLEHGRNQRAKYRDVKISYASGWQKNHWNSLCSCYRNSPYFEFYEDRLAPFFNQRFDFLFDFNKQLLEATLQLMNLNVPIDFTKSFEKTSPLEVKDFRSQIIPGSTDFFPLIYHQVFQERTGFLADLSILDLLFNEGPHSKELLLPSSD